MATYNKTCYKHLNSSREGHPLSCARIWYYYHYYYYYYIAAQSPISGTTVDDSFKETTIIISKNMKFLKIFLLNNFKLLHENIFGKKMIFLLFFISFQLWNQKQIKIRRRQKIVQNILLWEKYCLKLKRHEIMIKIKL